MLQGRIWSQAEIRKKISPCGIILHNRPARCSTPVKQTHKHTSTCLHTGHFQSRMLDLVDSSLIHLASPCTLKMEGSLLLLLLLCALLSSGPCLQMPTTLCSYRFVGDLKWCLSIYTPTHTCTCTHIFQSISVKLASPFLGFALVSTPHQTHMHAQNI